MNDTEYSLSKADRVERKKYYGFVRLRKDEIKVLDRYMNRATRWLLDRPSPFFFWNIELGILHLLKRIKNARSN